MQQPCKHLFSVYLGVSSTNFRFQISGVSWTRCWMVLFAIISNYVAMEGDYKLAVSVAVVREYVIRRL
jgi:hypothetical protein